MNSDEIFANTNEYEVMEQRHALCAVLRMDLESITLLKRLENDVSIYQQRNNRKAKKYISK